MNENPRSVSSTAFAFVNISDPLVAWLAYRGEMVSAQNIHDRALSVWHARRLEGITSDPARMARYAREVALDRIRRERFSGCVSRLDGFYAFPDDQTARRAAASWGGPFRLDSLVEIGLLDGAQVSQYDSEWITHSGSVDPELWATQYFSGSVHGSAPLWELVVRGRAVIFGTELRETAYEQVKRTWPDSLGLLELARIAVDLRSDLGLCTAMIFSDGGSTWVDYVMNFEDADDAEFLSRFAAYEGPTNVRDLKSAPAGVLPDLSSRKFRIA